jgi:hypothetical protein
MFDTSCLTDLRRNRRSREYQSKCKDKKPHGPERPVYRNRIVIPTGGEYGSGWSYGFSARGWS